MDWLSGLGLSEVSIPTPVALAAVTVLAYLFGRRQRVVLAQEESQNARREMRRAQAVAKDLETIAKNLRKQLARHHASVAKFRVRVSDLGGQGNDGAWRELCKEAEDILGPTMQLASQIAHAYDEIRQQSHQLMTLTEVRTDQLTGVSNRRALDETLKAWVAMKQRYELNFSIAIFDIDHFKKINDERGHIIGDQMLKQFAALVCDAARETDIVTRFGGEEFVVLMPKTGLSGGCVFADRVRRMSQDKMAITVSGGVAEALHGESPETLLERSDSALYHAKSAGRNRISLHDGQQIVPAEVQPAAPSAQHSEGEAEPTPALTA
ncbi:MAG: diguanylate cyclase [Planctomycetes bacterium]|nr:diguanylate cyclase [Planctomycetota bacterium]